MYLDQLLKGTFDLHCHVYPEMTLEHEARQDDIGQLAGMQAAGMGGVVLKSHFWPTVDRCYYLGQQFPGLKVIPSITLSLPLPAVQFRLPVDNPMCHVKLSRESRVRSQTAYQK